jgi:anaphase-promoting complex subunit 4
MVNMTLFTLISVLIHVYLALYMLNILCDKNTGQFLSLGWSDGVVRLMGLENNKAAHHIPVCDKAEAAITHIGWSTAVIASKTDGAISSKIGDEITKGLTEPGAKVPLDLPQELTFLEVETALPKISPLPTSSAGAG